jgi:dTDP-4-amino-4,6-dideoxygalactose transaminase
MIKSNIKSNHKYDIIFSGHNYRLSDINCALGLSQLKKINLFTKKRNTISRNYSKMLNNIPGIILNWKEKKKKYSSCHLYIILIDFSFFKTTRDKLMGYLYKKGITTQVHYIPLFKHSNFKNLNINQFNGTNNYYSKCLSLPIYYSLKLKDQKYIVKNIKKYLKII